MAYKISFKGLLGVLRRNAPLTLFVLVFMLVGGYFAYKYSKANTSDYVRITANNAEGEITVYTNSNLVIYWEYVTYSGGGGGGCYAYGTWGNGRPLAETWYSASGYENRSGDTATVGVKEYTINCDTTYGASGASVVVNVIAPPPPPPPPSSPPPAPTPTPTPTPSPTPTPTPPPPPPGSPPPSPPPSISPPTTPGTPTSFSLPPNVTASPRPNPPPPTFTVTPSAQPSNGLNIVTVAVSEQTYTTATINWTTNKNATGRVEYSEDAGMSGSTTVAASNPNTTQSVVLSGLKPGLKYYFRIMVSAESVETPIDGQFDTQGLPVRIGVTDSQSRPIANAKVTIGSLTGVTDKGGQTFFNLPIGPTTATISSNKKEKQFIFTVEDNIPADPKSVAEEQVFSFSMPATGISFSNIAIVITALLGMVLLIRAIRHRSDRSQQFGFSQPSQPHHQAHHKKPSAKVDVPVSPPPITISPADLPAQAQAAASQSHHIPDWQAQIQEELRKSTKAQTPETPKDMFETAEEQYHYDQKLKKPPHHKQ